MTSPNRQGLVRPMSHKTYFYLGSVIHQCLDLMAQGKFDPISSLDAVFKSEIDAYEKQYEAAIGVPFSIAEREIFDEPKELAKSMVEMYFEHYETNSYRTPGRGEGTLGPNFSYIHSELTFSIPIPELPEGCNFRGTLDGIARNNETGHYWIVEHKTYQRPPNLNNLLLDDQFRCYQWAFKQLTGNLARGIIYDGLLKKAPTVPHLLKNGTMSRREIDTTVNVYYQALRNAGLDPEDYEDVLERLEAKETSSEHPFFDRHFITISESSLVETELLIQSLYLDMSEPDVLLYPNRPFSGCYDCTVRPICDARTMGDDVEAAAANYIIGEPYGTFNATDPVTPSSGFTLSTTPLYLRQA